MIRFGRYTAPADFQIDFARIARQGRCKKILTDTLISIIINEHSKYGGLAQLVRVLA